MKVLKVENGEQKIVNYPRADKNPVFGLSEDIQYYAIDENKPVYDSENQFIEFSGWELTTTKDSEFKHLNIAKKQWQIKDIVREKTIEEKVKDLEDIVIVLSKEEKDRTASDKEKINEIKNKIETKTIINNGNTRSKS